MTVQKSILNFAPDSFIANVIKIKSSAKQLATHNDLVIYRLIQFYTVIKDYLKILLKNIFQFLGFSQSFRRIDIT